MIIHIACPVGTRGSSTQVTFGCRLRQDLTGRADCAGDQTDNLYQRDREYNPTVKPLGRGEFRGSPFACISGSDEPARTAVKAEHRELI